MDPDHKVIGAVGESRGIDEAVTGWIDARRDDPSVDEEIDLRRLLERSEERRVGKECRL